MHEPAAPSGGRTVGAEEFRELSVDNENGPGSVQVRQNTGQRPPSEVREDEAEHR
jgi:hypothetical protein